MNGHVRKRGKGWVFVVDVGAQKARRCSTRERGHVVWIDEHSDDECPRCGMTLEAPDHAAPATLVAGVHAQG